METGENKKPRSIGDRDWKRFRRGDNPIAPRFFSGVSFSLLGPGPNSPEQLPEFPDLARIPERQIIFFLHILG
jgi:hypothetical protein